MKTLPSQSDPNVTALHVALTKHHLALDVLDACTYRKSSAVRPQVWLDWLARLSCSVLDGLPNGEREVFGTKLREAIMPRPANK